MQAAPLVGSSASAGLVSGASSLSLPGGIAAGDVTLIAQLVVDPDATPAAPSGFTLVGQANMVSARVLGLYVFARTYVPGDTGPSIPGPVGGDSYEWNLSTWRGVSLGVGTAGTPYSVHNVASVTMPGVTPGASGGLSVGLAGSWHSSAASGTIPLATPSGWTAGPQAAESAFSAGPVATLGTFYKVGLGASGDAVSTKSNHDPADSTSTSLGIQIPFANTAPTSPAVTGPTGLVVGATTITWTAGSDADGDPLTYDLEYTRDNGGSWLSVATGVSGTSRAWDVSAIANSAVSRVRARSSDGLVYSAWAEGATFTINNNVAPNAPGSLSPDGSVPVERGVIQRLSWVISDPNVGDTQSKFDLRWRLGAGAWTTVTTTTPNQFYDAPAATFPAGVIEWQVRTYDAQGVVGPYSSSAFFTAATTPGIPTIVGPTNGSTIGSGSGAVDWSTPSQQSYQVRKVADSAGSPDTATVYYDSGEVVSTTARTAALTFPVNSRYEHLQVRVKDSGLWSSWASVRVLVSYTPPATPTVVITTYEDSAALGLTWTDPTPTGTQPTVTTHQVWVRTAEHSTRSDPHRPFTADGVRVAVGQTYGWTDRSPASGVDYEYRVEAVGSNGTSTFSAWTGAATEALGGSYGGY